ncbi:cupin domain protein [Aspergillus ellipticus CBS 707.79]|uniref:Cupin domain protein n=1 Tax=Aspergillus ellipticus CBS 707.79 TaxID=1448320 RepID=A0A319D8K9_9EURO|nr:cupin domain protein [Aspergillus ellipticus CBS 707.79]
MPSQPPSDLPNYTRHITTHNSAGHATIHSSTPAQWTNVEQGTFGFSVAYTTNAFPADLNRDADINAYESVMASNSLGLVSPNGTVCRVVDFAPGKEPLMHRTRSLDYGIVLEGEIVMELDSGEKTVLKKGDIAVQRATMHAWRNPSPDKWTRMLFVLQDCQAVSAGGQELAENLGRAADIPSSN